VAFVHFDGADELIERSGPRAAAEALDELVRSAQRAADRHGVSFLATDIDRDGGKIILAAGAPQSSGQDEERMLLALREVLEDEHRLPVRIGVNRGHVFAGDIGPPYRRTYTVMGDAVNLAARLMAKAEPGQLLATREVLRRSRTIFRAEALPPFEVKGKAEPVSACSVGEVAGSKGEVDSELPLVGREEELEELTGLLFSARRGRGRIVELAGGPGIGKSRLVQELRARAVGTTRSRQPGGCGHGWRRRRRTSSPGSRSSRSRWTSTCLPPPRANRSRMSSSAPAWLRQLESCWSACSRARPF
jgi:class 3 adenylate cyclase